MGDIAPMRGVAFCGNILDRRFGLKFIPAQPAPLNPPILWGEEVKINLFHLNQHSADDAAVEVLAGGFVEVFAGDEGDPVAGFVFLDHAEIVAGDEFVLADFVGVGFTVGLNSDLVTEFEGLPMRSSREILNLAASFCTSCRASDFSPRIRR